MKSRPPVTIIINNYNCEAFVEEAISSALAQTYQQVEVIVVDDGSTDSSISLLHSYAGRVNLVLKANGGQGSAFNAGFARSRGDPVLFLDADDILAPDAAEIAVAALHGRKASVAHWPLALFGSHLRKGYRRIPALPLSSGNLRDRVISYGPASHIAPPTSGNAWSRGFLIEVLPMPEEPFRLSADNYLHTLSPIYGEIISLGRPLGAYRIHEKNRYFHQTVLEKSEQLVSSYYDRCLLLAHHLRLQGTHIDPDVWMETNRHFQWVKKVHRTLSKMCSTIPERSTYVLIDGGKLSTGASVVPGRVARQFMERDGSYYGLPLTAEAVQQEILGLISQGVSHVVIVADMYWWKDKYRHTLGDLNRYFRCIISDSDVTIYEVTHDGE